MTQLVFNTQAFVNFRDHKFAGHGRRWVDVKYFRIAPESLDDELLALLVADEQFRDDYAGGGTDPAGQRHGPYWHCHITMDAYREVGSAAAVRTVRHWAWPARRTSGSAGEASPLTWTPGDWDAWSQRK